MNTVLFDLDGTLLPMDMKEFERVYFRGLCAAVPETPKETMLRALYAGIGAMVKNDGALTNREAFAAAFDAAGGPPFYENEERFLRYYQRGFQECKRVCGLPRLSGQILRCLKAKGYRVAIATNPLFPQAATYARLQWLGIEPQEAALVSTYEDSRHAKPNPAYFQEVCERLQAAPEDCLMVGNDVQEDGAAQTLGIPVMLITDCLINGGNLSLDGFWTGSLREFYGFARALPPIGSK